MLKLGYICVFVAAVLLLPPYVSGELRTREINVSNAGHRLHMTLYSTRPLGSGHKATIVFESGLGGGASNWRQVIERLPKGTPAITYERPGLGGSEADGISPTPEHIATVLHAALNRISSPPFVLVGHSWGGPLVRAFIGLFPNEVCGLVLVDPTDFGETAEGRRKYIYEPLGYGDEGEKLRAIVDAYYASQAGHFEPAVEAEIEVSREERRNDFPSIKSMAIPTVPVVVIATTKYPFVQDSKLPVPYDQAHYQQLMLNYRLMSLGIFARSVPNGTLVTTAKSGHYVQKDEPDLVAWAIKWVLETFKTEKVLR